MLPPEVEDVLQAAIAWEQNPCEVHAEDLAKAVQAYIKTRPKVSRPMMRSSHRSVPLSKNTRDLMHFAVDLMCNDEELQAAEKVADKTER